MYTCIQYTISFNDLIDNGYAITTDFHEYLKQILWNYVYLLSIFKKKNLSIG